MQTFIIKFGDNQLSQTLTPGLTVQNVLDNPNLAAVLGYEKGQVEVYSAGCKLAGSANIVADDVLVLSKLAHTKA